MFWSTLAHAVALLLDLFTARRQAEGAKDLEIALLRHQLRMQQRRHPRSRLSRWERVLAPVVIRTNSRPSLDALCCRQLSVSADGVVAAPAKMERGSAWC